MPQRWLRRLFGDLALPRGPIPLTTTLALETTRTPLGTHGGLAAARVTGNVGFGSTVWTGLGDPPVGGFAIGDTLALLPGDLFVVNVTAPQGGLGADNACFIPGIWEIDVSLLVRSANSGAIIGVNLVDRQGTQYYGGGTTDLWYLRMQTAGSRISQPTFRALLDRPWALWFHVTGGFNDADTFDLTAACRCLVGLDEVGGYLR